MSNIEPTEEQKQAANDLIDTASKCTSWGSLGLAGRIARLLAEREAKLREELSGLDALDSTMSDLVEVTAERDTLRARVAELEARPQFASVSSDGFIATSTGPVHVDDVGSVQDALEKRVAELENSLAACRGTLFADDRYSEAREAQHLADIKALMAKRLVDMREAARWGAGLALAVDNHVDGAKIAADIMEEFAKFDAEDELLQRLAHYDDAKAAEGGEG